MRDIRCVGCNRLFFKMEGNLSGHIEKKCERCGVFNLIVDVPRGNSLPLGEMLAASSA